MPPELRKLLKEHDMTPADVFEAMIQEMAAQKPK
jgi:hypothetical protein